MGPRGLGAVAGAAALRRAPSRGTTRASGSASTSRPPSAAARPANSASASAGLPAAGWGREARGAAAAIEAGPASSLSAAS